MFLVSPISLNEMFCNLNPNVISSSVTNVWDNNFSRGNGFYPCDNLIITE